ncbi:MAG: transposase [Acidobacteriota bacterium]|nr:MAG: transposase [Acidobacteriota bacterium]
MKPYPLELRRRIIEVVDLQYNTIEEVAEIFDVSVRYVYKLLKLYRDVGDLSPQPHGGGAKAKMNEQMLMRLVALVAEFPDATLDELRKLLRRRYRVNVSTNTVWRALKKIDFTLKKRPDAPARRISESERHFVESR